jgi:hypothetical protein
MTRMPATVSDALRRSLGTSADNGRNNLITAGRHREAANFDFELTLSHPVEELVRSPDQRLMRPHMMHHSRKSGEHAFGQIEDIDWLAAHKESRC